VTKMVVAATNTPYEIHVFSIVFLNADSRKIAVSSAEIIRSVWSTSAALGEICAVCAHCFGNAKQLPVRRDAAPTAVFIANAAAAAAHIALYRIRVMCMRMSVLAAGSRHQHQQMV
jgi:hypothetical protein